MDSTDLRALLPLLITAGTAVAVMLVTTVRRGLLPSALTALAGLAAAFVSIISAAEAAPRQITPLLIVDAYALFFTGLVLAAAMASGVLAYGYLRKQKEHGDELYILLVLATLGSEVLTLSTHFASFFLGLEILSISLYAMISYLQGGGRPLEAGLKYLVLAAASAAFLLFGMALIYAELGTMELSRITAALGATGNMVLLLPGAALIIVGIGFKLGVVPFHMWTPDVYEGSPAPVTAFIATVSKGAVFAFLLRYFHFSGVQNSAALSLIVSIVAIASMFAGNLLALLQKNVKRILAYSSIAHLGYLLVTIMAAGAMGSSAAAFYLVAYFISALGAFGVVTVLSESKREAENLEDYRGLFWQRPVLAGFFTAMLLSLAGIPLTAGFLGKFFIVAAGASAKVWDLIIILVITSSIGLFYYVRIIVAMFEKLPQGEGSFLLSVRISHMESLMLAALSVLLIWIGIYPAPLLGLIRAAMAGM